MKKCRLIFACAAATLLSVGGLTSCGPQTSQVLTYDINKEDVAGATISLDKTSAKVGEVVTVTVQVTDTTKEVDKVLANNLAVGANSSGNYSFTMPNGAVTVKVTLKEKEVPLTFNATVEPVDGVTLTLNKSNGLLAGEEVSGKATSNDNTKFVSHILVGNLKVALSDQDGNFSFAMPSENVTVKGVLELIPLAETFTATVSEVEGATLTLSNNNEVEAGTIVSGTVNVTDTSKVIDHILVGDAKVFVGDNGLFSFAMPSKDVEVKVVLKDAPVQISYNATVTPVEGAVVTLSKTEGIVPGEEVSGKVELTDSTKLLSHLLVNTQKVFTNENNEFTFVAPNKDATVEAILVDDPAQVLYPIAIADNCKTDTRFEGKIIDPTTKEEVTEAKEGTKLRLYLKNIQTEAVTHEVTDIRINKTTSTETVDTYDILHQRNSETGLYDYYYDFEFTKDITTISFFPSKFKYDISYTFNGCKGTFDSPTKKANAGDTVRFYPRIASGFEIKKVSVKDASGKEVAFEEKHVTESYTETREIYYEFEMPASKVNVVIDCVATSECIFVNTDAHSQVTNFRDSKDAVGTTEVIEPNSTMNLGYVGKEGQDVYFNVETITDENGVQYLIDDVYYSTDGWATQKTCNVDTNTGVCSLRMPRGKVEIKVVTKQAYIPVTVDTPEGTKLEFFIKKDNQYVKLDNKLPAEHTRIFFKFTDENATEDQYRDIDKLTVTVTKNGKEESPINFMSGVTIVDGYYSKWYEAKGDSIKFAVTTVTKTIIFKGKEFVGKYKGSKLSFTTDWYGDSELEVNYAEIADTGAYYFGTNSTGGLGIKVLTLGEDGKTLTYGSDKFVYNNGWLLKQASTIDESSILKKDGTSSVSSLKTVKIDGSSTKALIEQSMGSKYYHFVDLATNTFLPGVTINYLSGTSLSSGTIVEVKNGEELITTLELSSSSKANSVTADGLGGTYKVAEGGTSVLGDLVLNGFGKANATGFNYSKYNYTVEGDIITLIGSDSGSSAKVLRKVKIDKAAKTFVDMSLQTDLLDFNTTNFVSKANATGSDGKTYQFKVTLNDGTIEISYYEVVDGKVSTTKNRLTNYYCNSLFDLSGSDIKVKINEEGNFVGSETIDILFKKNEGAKYTLTMSGQNLKSNSSSVTFNLTNLEFVVA